MHQECADKILKQDPTINVQSRGKIQIKGKGALNTYWVLPGARVHEVIYIHTCIHTYCVLPGARLTEVMCIHAYIRTYIHTYEDASWSMSE